MILAILYTLFIIAEICFAFFAAVYALSALYSSFMGSAYVPTKQKEVEYILKEAGLKKGQVFYDLGCGDGRVVRTAVKQYKVKGTGIDISPVLIFIANIKCLLYKVKGVRFRVENIVHTDIHDADVIFIFLMPAFIEKLAPLFKKKLKKKTLVISHGFKIVQWDKNLVKTIHHIPFPTYFYRL